MNYKKQGRPQGNKWTDEIAWHLERGQGIGGSEIAAILGESEWMTAYQLWEYKTGKKESKNISNLPHIQRGVLGEKIARKMIETQTSEIFVPFTWTIDNTPYRCSDDGYCEASSTILEIKCMSARAHAEFKDKVTGAKTYEEQISAIPIYYLHQCIWNLFVSGASKCKFISFNPETEDMAIVVVKPDSKKAKRYVKAVDKFWRCVTTKIPPELSDKDTVVIQDAAFFQDEELWLQLKDEESRLRDRIGEVEDRLRGFAAKHPRVKGRLVQVSRSFRAGSVDYKRAFSEARISLDAYRREPTELVRITHVKTEDA